MKVEYIEGGRVKQIIDVREVDFHREDNQIEIISKRGKSKLKPRDSLLSVSE